MSIKLDREKGAATVQQEGFVKKLMEEWNVTEHAVHPSTTDFFEDDPSSPLLKDQSLFLSLNASLNYAGCRTYPELLPVSTLLARKYYKATESDMKKARQGLAYMNHYSGHCLYLRPRSLQIVESADASYAEHDDAKSHSGGCVGFEGDGPEDCYFMFTSRKQPIVAKSSTESELICMNTVADSGEWLRIFLDEMGLWNHQPVRMKQDNKSTIIIANQGTGTFKRTKHIRVRYFWVKDLIDQGLLTVDYVPTKEMVADILSKPLVGAQFKYLLAKLLGWNNM